MAERISIYRKEETLSSARSKESEKPRYTELRLREVRPLYGSEVKVVQAEELASLAKKYTEVLKSSDTRQLAAIWNRLLEFMLRYPANAEKILVDFDKAVAHEGAQYRDKDMTKRMNGVRNGYQFVISRRKEKLSPGIERRIFLNDDLDANNKVDFVMFDGKRGNDNRYSINEGTLVQVKGNEEEARREVPLVEKAHEELLMRRLATQEEVVAQRREKISIPRELEKFDELLDHIVAFAVDAMDVADQEEAMKQFARTVVGTDNPVHAGNLIKNRPNRVGAVLAAALNKIKDDEVLKGSNAEQFVGETIEHLKELAAPIDADLQEVGRFHSLVTFRDKDISRKSFSVPVARVVSQQAA